MTLRTLLAAAAALALPITGVHAQTGGAAPTAAPAAPSPQGGDDAACHAPAAEAQLVEEQRDEARRRRLARHETAFGQRLAVTLPARLDALAVGQRRALEHWAYREAYRQTRACLAAEFAEPFCAAIVAGDAARCGQVIVGDEGAVHHDACVAAVAIHAAHRAGGARPCAELDGALGDFCRMTVTGAFDCGSLGGESDPIRGLCELSARPSLCPRDDEKGAQACALMQLVRGLRGDVAADCGAIDPDRFPRLRAACRVVTAARDTCPPASSDSAALGRCAEPAPWTPEATRQGDAVVVDAAVANVLDQELRCYVETRLQGDGGAETALPDIPLPAVAPGRAHVQRDRVPLPEDAAGAPVARLRCAWKRPHPGAVPRIRPFGGASAPDPGGGAPPRD